MQVLLARLAWTDTGLSWAEAMAFVPMELSWTFSWQVHIMRHDHQRQKKTAACKPSCFFEMLVERVALASP